VHQQIEVNSTHHDPKISLNNFLNSEQLHQAARHTIN